MTKNRKGFTIIEVVLVLAIAGLIFLMVFIALPALQRSQRNTQRKDDIARIITAINDYQGNNSGKSPFKYATSSDNFKKFVARYIKGDASLWKDDTAHPQFSDPNGSAYTFNVSEGAKTGGAGISGDKLNEVDNVIYVKTKAGCGDEENKYKYSNGSADVALFYIMEGGQILCNDNH